MRYAEEYFASRKAADTKLIRKAKPPGGNTVASSTPLPRPTSPQEVAGLAGPQVFSGPGNNHINHHNSTTNNSNHNKTNKHKSNNTQGSRVGGVRLGFQSSIRSVSFEQLVKLDPEKWAERPGGFELFKGILRLG